MTFRAAGGVELLIDSTRMFAALSAAIWLFISASKGETTMVTAEVSMRRCFEESIFPYFHNQ